MLGLPVLFLFFLTFSFDVPEMDGVRHMAFPLKPHLAPISNPFVCVCPPTLEMGIPENTSIYQTLASNEKHPPRTRF